MNETKFARAAKKGGFEYGYIKIKNTGGANEERTHIVLGKAETMQEALRANGMALTGQPNIGGALMPAAT